MAPRTILIDNEWASKLIGIQVVVPNHWWKGCRGSKRWNGQVVSFNSSEQKWMFVVVDNGHEEEEYGLSYEGLLEYIDVNADTNAQYTNNPNLLPSEPFRGNGEEELAIGAEGVITKYKKTPDDQ